MTFKPRFLVSCLLFLFLQPAQAVLRIEIVGSASSAIPIAVVPFAGEAALPESQRLSKVIVNDLLSSGLFAPLPESDVLAAGQPFTSSTVDHATWRKLGTGNVVVGSIQRSGGSAKVRFELVDVYTQKTLLGYEIPVTGNGLRTAAHRISDFVHEKLTGRRGVASSMIAYVTSSRSGGAFEYRMVVADADGNNPRTVYRANEPILSPSWSPDRKKLAYVAYDSNGQTAIYVHALSTGRARKVAAFPGVNQAPSWSPDGKHLVVALSHADNPDIYRVNLLTNKTTQLTNHPAIDTEPVWSPDGQEIVFTSDRAGQTHIYSIPAGGGPVKRVSWEGLSNARAAYSPDGKHLAMIYRDQKGYRVAVLNRETGAVIKLSDGPLDESPSFSPNSYLLIYSAQTDSGGELAIVSIDGRFKQRLSQSGNVREPAWSPIIGR